MLFSGVSRHTSTTRSRRGVEAGPDGERSLHPEYNLMPDIEEFAAFADQLDGNREQSEQVVRLALSRVTATERRRRTVLALNAAAAAVDGTFADLDRAVEELRVQNEALLHARVEVEESSAIYRDFFERAPFAYVITNTATHITYANDAACTLFRRPKNALVRKPLACFVPLSRARYLPRSGSAKLHHRRSDKLADWACANRCPTGGDVSSSGRLGRGS